MKDFGHDGQRFIPEGAFGPDAVVVLVAEGLLCHPPAGGIARRYVETDSDFEIVFSMELSEIRLRACAKIEHCTGYYSCSGTYLRHARGAPPFSR